MGADPVDLINTQVQCRANEVEAANSIRSCAFTRLPWKLGWYADVDLLARPCRRDGRRRGCSKKQQAEATEAEAGTGHFPLSHAPPTRASRLPARRASRSDPLRQHHYPLKGKPDHKASFSSSASSSVSPSVHSRTIVGQGPQHCSRQTSQAMHCPL